MEHRVKIFISHATPEDNYFAGWLAAKLSLAGFDVWCDLDVLQGGEDFWKDIEKTIREETAKFVFVLSSTSMQKRGTLRELAIADKLNAAGDFIVPVRIDNVSSNDLPGELIRLNYINFCHSWADGLRKLLQKFEKEKVIKVKTTELNVVDFWQRAQAAKDEIITAREEGYWSNWFEIKIPDFVYFHFPSPLALYKLSMVSYPAFPESNYIISFACEKCVQQIPMDKSIKISTATFLKEKDFQGPQLGIIEDANKKIIRLLNEAFSLFLVGRGLKPYHMATDTIYYFLGGIDHDNPQLKINLARYNRRSINLFGTSRGANWHFAIGGQAFLYPLAAFAVDYHVIFTSPASGLPLDKATQHTYRRKLSWYNKKWRDLVLGSFLWLGKENENDLIPIRVCEHQEIEFKLEPIMFQSQIGYFEPTKEEELDEQDIEVS
jgi:hypothetical protein